MIGQFENSAEVIRGVAEHALLGQADSSVQVTFGVVGPHAHHLVEVGESGVVLTLLGPQPAAMKIGVRELGITPQGAIKIVQGEIRLGHGLQSAARGPENKPHPGKVKSRSPC